MSSLSFKKLLKRHWPLLLFFGVTLLIFSTLVTDAPPIVWDAANYNNLSQQILVNNLNIFSTDLGKRTFFYPLYLALNRGFLYIFGQNHNLIFYFIPNLILFYAATFVIFKIISEISRKVAFIFLLISSFNIINLSFTTVLLTENLTTFLIAITLYLLTRTKQSVGISFLLAVTSSILVFTRPASILLFFVITLLFIIKSLSSRKYIHIGIFLLCGFSIFSVGLINTYKTTGDIAVFSKQQDLVYLYQVTTGAHLLKYETSIDESVNGPAMSYVNPNTISLDINCEKPYKCIFYFLKQNPKDYLNNLLIHTFSMFDRVYIDTYIKNLNQENNILRLGNYIILTSLLIYLIFFGKSVKIKKLLKMTVLITIALLVVYIPTAVEPRFTGPVFPLMITVSSFYFYKLYSIELTKKLRYLTLQILLIILFYMISIQTELTLSIGPVIPAPY